MLQLSRNSVRLSSYSDLSGYKEDNSKLESIYSQLINQENVYGNSNKHCDLMKQYGIFYLLSSIKYEISRGANTDFDYYYDRYDFASLNTKLECLGLDLYGLLCAFGLFTSTLTPPGGIPSTPPINDINFMDITRDLIKGVNTVTHSQNKLVKYLKVVLANGWTQEMQWRVTDNSGTENLNQVYINSPASFTGCTIILGFNS